MSPSDISAPGARTFLASRPGAALQVGLIAAGAMALPGNYLLSAPLLAVVAAVCVWLSGDNWRSIGLGRPTRRVFWWLSAAVVGGVLWQYAAAGVLAPLAGRVAGAAAPAGAAPDAASGSYLLELFSAGLVQPLAKGLAYRGFLLNRLERLLGTSVAGRVASLVIASILLGLSNAYQGAAGVLVSILTGAALNAFYYWAGRSVWPPVTAHAVYNAVGLTLLHL